MAVAARVNPKDFFAPEDWERLAARSSWKGLALVAHAWAVLGVLFVVSLAFSYVRIATHSVACSTLMHATYNFTIFAVLFVASGGFRHLDKLSK